MSLKILHTADWHIGQSFHGFDRHYEHEQFLNWLLDTLAVHAIDVLLISGDVFDQSNPPAQSVRLFYSFLNRAGRANPELQIIITAGNHDSAPRLESPKPLLESSNVHIIGVIGKNELGAVDYNPIVVPLKDRAGKVAAWCLAVPFLRLGDYSLVESAENPYGAGVTQFYKEIYEHALIGRTQGQAIIAMGHLHAQQADANDIDDPERLIMGGVECISAAAFHSDICYVALGHIHKAQRLGGRDHVRYSGSPLPMSFTEHGYRHQVVCFELEDETARNIATLDVPVSVRLQCIPGQPRPLPEVLDALSALESTDTPDPNAAFVEVRVRLEGPDPALRHKIEAALEGKRARLAKISVSYLKDADNKTNGRAETRELASLNPEEILRRVYDEKYKQPIDGNLLSLFRQAAEEVNQQESAS